MTIALLLALGRLYHGYIYVGRQTLARPAPFHVSTFNDCSRVMNGLVDWKKVKKGLATLAFLPLLVARADDELANYAANGNIAGVEAATRVPLFILAGRT